MNMDEGAILSLLEVSAPDPKDASVRLRGDAWSKEGVLVARYRSRAVGFDEGSRTLSYYWSGEHPRDSSLPRFVGVGEITFGPPGKEPLTASGFYTSSNLTEPNPTQLKSTRYVRATTEEVRALDGAGRDERAAVVQARLRERREFDV